MSTITFRSAIPRQLRHWSIYCTLNAFPAFCIAFLFLDLSKSPTGVLAMVAAIATFIFSFAVITSLPGPLSEREHLLARALVLGTRIRAGMAVLSIPLLFTRALTLVPDFLCGLMVVDLLKTPRAAFHFSKPSPSSPFFHVYLTTILVGLALTILLLLISFGAAIYLQGKDRRRFQKSLHPSRMRSV